LVDGLRIAAVCMRAVPGGIAGNVDRIEELTREA